MSTEHITTPRRAWWENPLHKLCYQISSLQYEEYVALPHCRIHAKVAHTRRHVIVAYMVESTGRTKRFTDARMAAEYVMEIA